MQQTETCQTHMQKSPGQISILALFRTSRLDVVFDFGSFSAFLPGRMSDDQSLSMFSDSEAVQKLMTFIRSNRSS